MPCLLEQTSPFKNLKFQISDPKLIAENVSRQLRGFAGYLQNSDLKGQRYLNEKVRQAEKSARSQRDFLQKLRGIVDEAARGTGEDFGEENP